MKSNQMTSIMVIILLLFLNIVEQIFLLCFAPEHTHTHTLGYNEFDFLKKFKNTDPLMGAKFKSKTHFLITFLFMALFFVRFASKLEKSTW